MKIRYLLSISLMLFLIMGSLYQTNVKAEAQPPYLRVNILGGGTLSSNITGIKVEVAFNLVGVFWAQQGVEIPYLNATGTGIFYNITGSFKVEAESQNVDGTFIDATIIYKGKTYRFFIIGVVNVTEQLVFNALSFGRLIVPIPPGLKNYARYTVLFAATLLDLADYPRDFFKTMLLRLLPSIVVFPK